MAPKSVCGLKSVVWFSVNISLSLFFQMLTQFESKDNQELKNYSLKLKLFDYNLKLIIRLNCQFVLLF